MCLKQLSPAWFCEPVHSFCCCCCLLKWNLFAIGRAMSKVQTFQKVNRFLIAILYLPFGWAPSFLGLGAYCCLYLAWRPLIPGNSKYSSCFFPFRYLSSVLSKGDSTPSPFSLLFPTLPPLPPITEPTHKDKYYAMSATLEKCVLRRHYKIIHQPTFECWSKTVECLTHLASDTIWDLRQFRPSLCLLSLVSLAPSLSDQLSPKWSQLPYDSKLPFFCWLPS